MAVRISRALYAALVAHSADDPAREVCGLLFGSENSIDDVVLAANVAADPAIAFEIEPTALIAALRDERQGGRRLAGYFHSHPRGSAQPSATDRAMAAGDGRLWVIIAGSDVALWRVMPSGWIAETFEIGD